MEGALSENLSDRLPGSLSAIAAVASQAVFLAAILYYFGWSQTEAHFAYFGVDATLLGFSSADYVLRSADAALPPIVCAGLGGLALLSLHQRLKSIAASRSVNPKKLRIACWFLRIVGAFFAFAVLAGVAFHGRLGKPLVGLDLPFMLAGAVLCFTFAPLLLSPSRQPSGSSAAFASRRGGPSASHQQMSGPRKLILVALGLLAFFWWVALSAANAGHQTAEDSAREPVNDFQVILYSVDKIALSGPGVSVDPLNLADSKYRYRYSGLRLLAYSSGKYILLPQHWQHGRDSAFVVSDDENVRVDVIAPG